MGRPTISVLLPFFNARETVDAAIESVLAQTYDNWELIAVDDGSVDGSADVVSRIASHDPRVRVVQQQHGGLPVARNAGLAAAHGGFCALLDADDMWLPEKLESQLPLLDERAVVFSDAWVEEQRTRYRYGRRVGRPDGVYPRGDVFDELLRRNFVPSLTVVMPTALLREVGGFDVELPISPDWDLWLRLSLAGIRFDYVGDPLAVYRVRPGSLSDDAEALRREAVAVLRRLAARASGPRRTAAVGRLALARRELEIFLRKRAWIAAAERNTGSARQDLFASLRSNPRSPRSLAGAILAVTPPLLRWYARRQMPVTLAGEFTRP